MKHKLLFLFILLFSTTTFAQLQLEIDVIVTDLKSNKKEAGVLMKVFDGTKLVSSASSASNGKVALKVPAGKVYKVEFSKQGKVTRFFNVNSQNIDIELLQGASEPFVKTSISLFDRTNNVDYSFIESNAITDFSFDGKSTSLAYNKATADKMEKKVTEVIAQADKTVGNNEVQYQNKMKEGEAAATAQNYLDARTKFEQAQYFKPGDKLSIKRMEDMDKLVKADKISQIDGDVAGGAYDNLIQAAKTLKGQKKYQLAIDKYEEALVAKRNDQFALDEIDALMDLIQKEKRDKANEGAYTAAMSTGEALLKQKSYQAARDQYDLALKAKPGDAEATKKKNEVLAFLDAAKGAIEKKKTFDAAIAAGDQLFKAEKWEEAKVKYDEALAVESASTYAKGQNDIIKTKLEALEKAKALKTQIDQLLADGNKLFSTEKWEEAKVKYTEVKKLEDKNAIAIEKLIAVQLKIDEAKNKAALEANFKKLVDEGDLAAKGLKYEDAIAKYKAALELKASPEVEQKKTDAETASAKLKNQKEQKASFDLAMKEGETFLLANKLEEAKAKFTEANKLDETAQLPKDKIKAIDEKILANKSAKEKEEQFNASMLAANGLRESGKLEEAITEYKKAQGIDKTKTEPATKIKEVETEISTLAASKSAKEKEEQFNASMAAAKVLRESGKLEEAIAEYKKAQGIDKTKTEPATKIKEVETEISALAASKSAKEIEEKFNASMLAANGLREAGKLEEAITEYKKAQGIDKTKTEPATKIKEVETEISALAASKSAKEIEEKFNASMLAANGLREAGKLEEAITEYKKAQGIDKTKTEPATKIKEVETEISALAASKSAKEIEEKFNASMLAANGLREAGKLEEAITEYKKAQGIDKTKTEPATKIKEVETEISALAASKSAKEIEEKFNASMTAASALRTSGKLEEAITEYKKAQGIDNTKTEPATKIKEVETEIAALAASLAANNSAKEIEEKFNASMLAANGLRESGKLEEAITEYKKAQGIDNTKTEPATKIKEVETEISALAASLAANNSAKEKEEKFNASMTAANALRTSGKLEEAIAEYKKAQGIDNTKTEPATKIKEVETEISALAATLAANNSAKEKEEKFNASMTAASALRTSGKLEEAITEYKKAQGIDNTKTEPATKIKEVETEISALAASLAANNSAKEKEEKFTASMTAANALRTSGKLEEAITEYKKAQGIDNTKTEPATKIKEIQTEIDSKLVNKDDLAYTELMSAAASLEENKKYQLALEKYTAAKLLKPSEKKPADKIKALEILIREQDAQALIEAKYAEALKKGNDAMGVEDYLAAIKHFNSANKIKPNEIEPVEKARKAEEMSKNKTSEDDNLFEKMLLFAQQKMDEKDFVKAEELIKRAADNRPSDPRPVLLQKELEKQIKNRKDYQAKMTDAKESFDKKDFENALQAYNDAKAILPSETKPDEGIAAVKREMSLLEKSTQEDEIYLTTIKKAEAAVADKNYKVAIEEYKKAEALKPADKTIGTKIVAIQKIMTEMSLMANKQVEKLKFDGLVSQADNLFEQSKWKEAKAKYDEANGLMPNNSYVLEQLEKCTKNIAKGQNDLVKYKQLIDDADKKFKQANYKGAKEAYQKALEIDNRDSYPHSQLAKIDGVLNPVFAEDGKLQNLGIPTDNSLLEGQALLERAAKLRAHRSNDEFKNKQDEMDVVNRESAYFKNNETQALSIALKNKMEVQTLIELSQDEWRQKVVDSVRTATVDFDQRFADNNRFKDAEGQEARRYVTDKSAENEERYQVNHETFAGNTDKVKQTVVSEQDDLLTKSENLYKQQVQTKAEVGRIQIVVDENYTDDDGERISVVDSVRNAQKSLTAYDFDRSQEVMVKSMDIKSEVDQANLIRERKDVESDDSRQTVVDKVKLKQTELSAIETKKQTDTYEKSIAIRQDVTAGQKSIEVENKAYQENQDLKVSGLQQTQKEVSEITAQRQGNDDASRQKSKELITDHVIEVEKIKEEGSKAPEKNQAIMKNSTNTDSERQTKVEEGQVKKNYDARKFVEDIANKKMVFSAKVANEIGANYPEGVSQETFQKNGNDGLPTAFITRRIVVKNGYGEVYVRTQTLNAITYSRNGEPSTEYIWQKETSNANLTRNF
ncbi:MAG: hypothetical protein PHQ74_08160 [Crocinitomicaceae bacterium]|nr:hypothetical protein [Crocinitomicaceae bacterium]